MVIMMERFTAEEARLRTKNSDVIIKEQILKDIYSYILGYCNTGHSKCRWVWNSEVNTRFVVPIIEILREDGYIVEHKHPEMTISWQ